MNTRLRVGLLLDSYLLPAWIMPAIERIRFSDHAELALIILNQSSIKKDPSLAKPWQGRKHWLYSIFDGIDQKLFVRGQNALTQIDASDIFSKVPVLKVEPVGERSEQSFAASDIEQIKSYRLDILVKMGFGNLRGSVFAAANYGIWAYRWGDRRKIEDGLSGFWEAVEGWPETGAALQQLGVDADHCKTLFESWFFTYPYSPARNRNYILWAASSFLPRQVERLCYLGDERFLQEVKQKNHSVGNSKPLRPNRVPSNRVVLRIMARLAFRNSLEIYRRNFCREQWELLFDLNQRAEKDISTFRKISPPSDRFWADPHVIEKESGYYIFIEEYLYRTRRGHISVMEMDSSGNYKEPIPVLQKDYHLSFPSVFEWMGQYYMIPESSENRTIDLYECIKFPDRWQLKLTLMRDVKAVDTTVLHWQGKWWLFTAIAEQEAAAPQVELFLFYSNELFTDRWHAHPMNPIVSDIKRARAAGRIFPKDGRLVRPSQLCSSTYGYGFDLNEITVISEAEYCERTLISVRPDPMKGIIATHTYANLGGLTVIDALTHRPRWRK